MKIEVSKLEKLNINAKDLPLGRLGKVNSDLYLFKASGSTDEFIRIWLRSGEMQSISLTDLPAWEIELLPVGTYITLTF